MHEHMFWLQSNYKGGVCKVKPTDRYHCKLWSGVNISFLNLSTYVRRLICYYEEQHYYDIDVYMHAMIRNHFAILIHDHEHKARI